MYRIAIKCNYHQMFSFLNTRVAGHKQPMIVFITLLVINGVMIGISDFVPMPLLPPLVFFTRIFSALCDFFELFWIPPKGLHFVCFDILQHNGCQKIPMGPPFTFFGTVTMFKNLILKFFSEVFKNL